MKVGSQTQLAVKILWRLLAPAVKYCLRRSLSYQDASKLLKDLFIEEARKELAETGIDPTASRISALTGIRRPDINISLKSKSLDTPNEATFGNFTTHLIGRWMYDRRFGSSSGKPKPLSVVGEKSEFAQLVGSLSSDLNFRTILLELERMGVVSKKLLSTKKEVVVLNVDAFVARSTPEEGFSMLAEDIGDLSRAVIDNIEVEGDLPHLHARTIFDNLSVDDLTAVREWSLNLGAEVHKRAREFLSRFDRDLHPEMLTSKERTRVVFSTYSFAEILAAKKKKEGQEK